VSPRKTETQLSPEQAAAAAMVAEARQRGLELTGPHGLLKLFTKNVLEAALNEELTEHLGHAKNRAEPDRESTNIRNGTRPKTVISDAAGRVAIEVPRDREGTFEPQIVRKRQRRLSDVDEIVLSLYAKGLTTGEISAHFAEIYGASVSKETVPDHRHRRRRDDPIVAECVGRVRAVPRLRRRDPNRVVFDECDRVTERPLSAGGTGPGPFPE
jgi:putative transposase